jgi:LysM repeat protein
MKMNVTIKKLLVICAILYVYNISADKYQIKKGDTFYGISKKLNVEISEIQSMNESLDPNRLQIGDIIDVPELKSCIKETSSNFDIFIDSMCILESGGKISSSDIIFGDGENARGPLQIWKEYFQDAQEFSDDLIVKSGKYEDVDDFEFSKRVVIQYFNRYADMSLKNENFEELARIHNGGPNGSNPNYVKKYKMTGEYWKKLKRIYERRIRI